MYKKFTQKQKKITIENIKDYSEHKVLYELSKPKSPHLIKFVEDLNDNWFVYVLEYKKKTGEITDNSMIIAADVTTRLTHLQNCGYELKK
jgi:hypothetical protein